MSAILPDTQVLDIAKRCGLNRHLSGAAAEAVLVEFATLVREAEPLAAGDVFGKTEILHRPGGQVDPCMALPHVRTEAAPAPNTAGSATGFHLAKMSRDEVIKIMIKRDMLSQHGYRTLLNGDFISLNLDHLTALANAALARATPQHSVTEQVGEHEAFKAAMVAKHYVGSMFDHFLAEGEITYHDPVANQMYDAWQAARAQPLASTAAAQPEQASVERLRPALENLLHRYVELVASGDAGNWDAETEDEVIAARAALAIPASTAPTQQENEQANVLPPTRGTDSQHDAGIAILSALRDGIPLQEPVNISKAVLAQREARLCLSGGTGPVACAMLVNIQLTPWADGPEKAEAFVNGYNTAMKWYRSSLLTLADSFPASTAASERKPPSKEWYLHMAALESEAGVNIEAGAASEQQAGAIERIADELDQEAQAYEGDFADVVRGCVESLRALSGRATIPSEADEHEDFDRWADERLFSNPPLPVTAFDAWKAALAHRATTATKR